MKARTKVSIAVTSVIIFIATAIGLFLLFAAKNKTTYSLQTEEFDCVVEFNSDLDLNQLSIVKNVGGKKEVISITEDMILTENISSSVGEKKLIIKYGDEQFVVNVFVKYKVEFVVNDEVVEHQFALSQNEVVFPEDPVVDGLEFIGWGASLESLNNNMQYTAYFKTANNLVPKLPSVTATYGDTLESIDLPANNVGAWRFIDDLSTPVGNAGTNSFDVVFEPVDDSVAVNTAKLSIKVNKKKLEFKNVQQDFVFDGQIKQPVYKLEEDVNVIFTPCYSGDAKNVGEYVYELDIDDQNYKGSYYGKFNITPAQAEVIVDDVEIGFGDEVPSDFEFRVLNDLNQPMAENLVELLDFSVIKPSYLHAGRYQLDVLYNNKNFNVVVHNGYLIVNKVELDLEDNPPMFANSGKVVYGSTLSTVEFLNFDVRGKWQWENPNHKVLTHTEITAKALFIPDESEDYLVSSKNLTIAVEKKKLTIEISEKEFTYDGLNHTISYNIIGLEGEDQVSILGNLTKTIAGTYPVELAVDNLDKRYVGSTSTNLLINKASCSDFSKVYETTWSNTLLLENVELDNGYSWVEGKTPITKVGKQAFMARFTPEDAVNFKIEEQLISIDVAKANCIISASENYSFEYNPNGYSINNVVAPHNETNLNFVYYKQGNVVEGISTVGKYFVEVTLDETEHYNATRKTFEVNVEKCTNKDVVASNLIATYGDNLNKFSLPQSLYGSWSWVGDSVGNAGTKTHVAVFSPKDQDNYATRIVDVEFVVNKKIVEKPSIQNKTYNAQKQVATIAQNDLYNIVENNGGCEGGEYNVILELTDSSNYCWNDSEEKSTTLKFNIIKNNTNIWSVEPTIQGWKYGETEKESVGNSVYGDVIVEYKLKSEADEQFSTKKPSKAGTYIARFRVEDTVSYNGLEEVLVEFNIEFVEVSVPTISSTIYNGNAQKANIPDSKYYDVITNNEVVNAGSYEVVIKLNNDSYKWNDSFELERKLTFIINKVQNKDNYVDKYIATYSDLLSLYSLPSNPNGVWSWSETYVGNAGTHVHEAIFTPTDPINYESREIGVVFEVGKKVVQVPIISAKTFNNEKQTATVANTDVYTFTTNNGGTNVGKYVVVVELIDESNYRWAGKGDEKALNLDFEIVKNQANTWKINPAINSWTFGEEPSKTAGDTAFGELIVEYKLKSETDDSYTTIKPSKAGTYIARFSVENTNDYNGLSTEIEFNINYVVVSVPTILDTTYNTKPQTANVSTSDKYTIKTENLTYINAGTYDIVLELNNESYKWTDSYERVKTLQFIINKAENNDVISLTQNAIYKDRLSKFVLPTSLTGQWNWKTGGDSFVGDAGEQTHIAVFTPEDENNYLAREVEVKFNVDKYVVQLPVIKSTAFNDSLQVANIENTEEFIVVKNEGGIVKGLYDVELQLRDALNCRWAGKSDGEVKVIIKFEIAQNNNNDWITAPSISNWLYNSDPIFDKGETNFGSVVAEFKLKTASDDQYSTEVPKNAGVYLARFSVEEQPSYNGLTQTMEFEIKQIVVEIPTIASVYYNGEEQSATVADSDYYNVTQNNKYKNAGSYEVVITLINNNYKWTDSYELSKTLEFKIKKLVNTDVITTKYSAVYDDLLSKYSLPTSETGSWSWGATKVGNAGINKHTAIFTPTDPVNYESRTVEVEFEVSKKIVEKPTIQPVKFNNQNQTAVITPSSLYVVTVNNGGKVKGEYPVVLQLTDSNNYCWATNDDSKTTTIKFNIIKNMENNWEITPDIDYWTYSETASTPKGKAIYGQHEIYYKLKNDSDETYVKTMPEDAGVYVAKYVVSDDDSYNGLVQTVEFEIKYYIVATPANDETTYNGSKQKAEIEESKYYDVTKNEEQTNAGEYEVEVTLNNKNYRWSDISDLTRKIKFTIKKVVNEDVVETQYNAIYEDLLSKFELPNNSTGSWNWESNDVGEVGTKNITATFTPNDPTNYESRTVEVKFVVDKKPVEIPTITPQKYNGEEQTTALENTNLYKVVSQASGTNVGSYNATLQLEDFKNYCWSSNSTTKNANAIFRIIKTDLNDWLTDPTITSWTYLQEAEYSLGSAVFGSEEIFISYKLKANENGTYNEGLPTNVGVYDIKFAVPDNDNYNGIEFVITDINVYHIEVTAPTIASVVYDAQPHKASITSTDNYSIVANEEQVEAGSYDVVLSLPNSNYKWTDSYDLEKVLTFTINPATDNAWITYPTISNFTYSPTIDLNNYGTALSKYGEVEITYSKVDEDNFSSELVKNVGSYKAKFSMKYSQSYNLLDDVVIPFNINKATPTISGLNMDAVIYENAAENNRRIINNAITTSVEGEFVYDIPKLVTTSTASYQNLTFNLTFNPTDSMNYNSVSGTASINVYSVCYNGSTYYGSIENALNNAKENETITVIPNTSGEVAIYENVEVKETVKLVLPYLLDGAITCNENAIATLHYDKNTCKIREFGHQVLTNQVVVKSGVTIENNGEIVIAGEITSGAGGEGSAGQTARNFAELVLEDNAHIISNGIIRLYGYIDESSDDNALSSVSIETGSIYLPFIINDHRGGTFMGTAYTVYKITPFNQFEVRNVVPKLIVKSTANLIGNGNMYGDGQQNHTEAKLVGATTEHFIQLSDGARLEAKYNPIRESVEDNNRWAEGVSDIKFFGGAKTNTLSMEVAGNHLDTASVAFPLSWRQRIFLNDGDYEMTNSFKMLPGHEFVVEADANLKINSLNIYSTFEDKGIETKYKSGLKPAFFLVRGEVTATTIGGVVYSDTNGAKIAITNKSASTKEVNSYKISSIFGMSYPDMRSRTITNSLVLRFTTNAEASKVDSSYSQEKTDTAKNSTYTVTNNLWG